jgi:hypothetical protein
MTNKVSTPARWLITLVLSLVSFFAGGWVFGSRIEERPPEAVASTTAAIDPREPSKPLVELAKPPEPVRTPSEPGDAQKPSSAKKPSLAGALQALDQAIRESVIVGADDEAIAAKYEGISIDGLHAALTVLKRQAKEQERAIVDQRMRDGLYTEEFLVEGQKGTPVRGERKGITSINATQEPMPDGSLRTRTVTIPQDEYPEFKANMDEVWWLMRRLRGEGTAVAELMK